MNQNFEELLAPLTNQLQSTIGEWVQGQEKQYLTRLNKISAALSKAADELKNQDEQELGGLLENSVSGMNAICNQLEDAKPEEILSTIRSQTHQHPAGAFMASMVAGFLSSRVTKGVVASQTHDRDELTSDRDTFDRDTFESSDSSSLTASSTTFGTDSDRKDVDSTLSRDFESSDPSIGASSGEYNSSRTEFSSNNENISNDSNRNKDFTRDDITSEPSHMNTQQHIDPNSVYAGEGRRPDPSSIGDSTGGENRENRNSDSPLLN